MFIESRESEIKYAQTHRFIFVARDENVVGLQIAVDDSRFVRRVHTVKHLTEPRDNGFHIQLSFAI